MSAAVLDTSAYSAFRRGHAGLIVRVRSLTRVFLPSVAIGELRVGFLGGSRRKSNEEALRGFLASPSAGVAVVDAETSERYAVIRHELLNAGKPLPTNDLWIAACAMQLGLPVLTLDRHFLHIRQILVECYDPE